jgi:hypothetical protein
MIPIRHLGWTAFALIALVGCEPTTPPTTPDATKAPSEIKALPVEPGKAEEPKKEGAAVEKLSDEEIAEIKKLPPEDQKIALAQVTCPVSDGHLGDPGMGAPIKQVIGDKTFFICCSGCEKDVKTKPQEVLAKLKK